LPFFLSCAPLKADEARSRKQQLHAFVAGSSSSTMTSVLEVAAGVAAPEGEGSLLLLAEVVEGDVAGRRSAAGLGADAEAAERDAAAAASAGLDTVGSAALLSFICAFDSMDPFNPLMV
jgi:hypothetical protein